MNFKFYINYLYTIFIYILNKFPSLGILHGLLYLNILEFMYLRSLPYCNLFMEMLHCHFVV